MSDDLDRDVLHALRRMFDAVDRPPEHVVAHARDAFVWHGIDAELAELVYDSATAVAGGVRGTDAARQMTFRAPGLEIEVEVVSERTRIVTGQLVPAEQATVELRSGDRIVRTDTDALGRFTFDDVAAGAIKLSVITSGGTRVETEGLTI